MYTPIESHERIASSRSIFADKLDAFWLQFDTDKLYSYLHNTSDYDLAMEWYLLSQCYDIISPSQYHSFLEDYITVHLQYFSQAISRRFFLSAEDPDEQTD